MERSKGVNFQSLNRDMRNSVWCERRTDLNYKKSIQQFETLWHVSNSERRFRDELSSHSGSPSSWTGGDRIRTSSYICDVLAGEVLNDKRIGSLGRSSIRRGPFISRIIQETVTNGSNTNNAGRDKCLPVSPDRQTLLRDSRQSELGESRKINSRERKTNRGRVGLM